MRLADWEYSWSGWYYVTICTHTHNCLFGTIVENGMILNPVGRIVEEEWLRTPEIRPNVELDDFVIMPNHVHGIIIMNDSKRSHSMSLRRGVLQYAPTGLHSPSQTLGAIIRGFKGAATKRICRGGQSSPLTVWQRNYYEHIIRNEADLHRIREYIANNPLRWAIDKENPENIKRKHAPRP
jgi:REP element-mobilizing transposase RayT